MEQIEKLRAGWEQEQAAAKAAKENKGKKAKIAPDASELFEDDDENPPTAPSTKELFEDSDSDEDEPTGGEAKASEEGKEEAPTAAPPTKEDLFGDSSDEDSDEELMPSSAKRTNEDSEEQHDANDKAQSPCCKDTGTVLNTAVIIWLT